MFVRKRGYTCRKHGSYRTFQHQAQWDVPYYQVLESVRVDGKPRHRVIASWSGHRSLVGAILAFSEEVRTMHEQLDEQRAGLAAGGQKTTKRWFVNRVAEMERDLPRLRAKLDGLRHAHEVLGDWRDDRP
jgi:hypothetical protein